MEFALEPTSEVHSRAAFSLTLSIATGGAHNPIALLLGAPVVALFADTFGATR
jgi:hypothetical protein